MAFKDEIIQLGFNHYVLPVGKGVPAEIFMNAKLLQGSEELLWQEVAFIKSLPGVTKVVVTPDAHASGNGVPVGVVVETDGSVIIPCAAGYDISCGMAAVLTDLTIEDVKEDTKVRAWINAVIDRVALGAGRQRAAKQKVLRSTDIQALLNYGAQWCIKWRADKEVIDNLERKFLPVDWDFVPKIERAERGFNQLGSLGGGNHFLELDIDVNTGKVLFLIHTGSRGYGHGTAEYFFERGAAEQGLQKKDKEKCWFKTDSKLGKEYINSMNSAANFAIVNRLMIFYAMQEATEEIFGSKSKLFYEISHNLVQSEAGKLIHRKGATRALPTGHEILNGTKWYNTGHPIIIPGSMGTASAILFAKDSAKSLYSINHGCGRVLSRNKAKRDLASLQSDIDKEMQDMKILINTRNVPLDECLHAYKDIDEVLASVEGANLAEVKFKLKPRAVIKGFD